MAFTMGWAPDSLFYVFMLCFVYVYVYVFELFIIIIDMQFKH